MPDNSLPDISQSDRSQADRSQSDRNANEKMFAAANKPPEHPQPRSIRKIGLGAAVAAGVAVVVGAGLFLSSVDATTEVINDAIVEQLVVSDEACVWAVDIPVDNERTSAIEIGIVEAVVERRRARATIDGLAFVGPESQRTISMTFSVPCPDNNDVDLLDHGSIVLDYETRDGVEASMTAKF